MGENPSDFKNCGDNCPVESISWNDTQEFISRLNSKDGTAKYRLPTEAEWEYAARGAKLGSINTISWYGFNSNDQPHPVAQKKPNDWGLYDMTGNVWEWCQDWFDNYPKGPVVDPVGPKTGREKVFRGGSWSNIIRDCRPQNRYWFDPTYYAFDVGFRLVLVPDQ